MNLRSLHQFLLTGMLFLGLSQSTLAEEQIVRFGHSSWELEGILQTPDQGVADKFSKTIILLISGSGPQDVNYTVHGIPVFKQLAQHFANLGIATFRFPKRTHTYKDRCRREKIDSINQELVIDSKRALAALSSKAFDFEKILIVGHSLGGTVAPFLTNSKSVLGCVTINTPSNHPFEFILDQLHFLKNNAHDKLKKSFSPAISQAKKTLAKYEEGSLQTDAIFFGSRVSYWLDWGDFVKSQPDQIKDHTKPTLIIGCGHDYQANLDDFNFYKQLLSACEHVSFLWKEKLNHFLIKTSSVNDTSLKKNAQIDPSIADDIIAWLNEIIEAR